MKMVHIGLVTKSFLIWLLTSTILAASPKIVEDTLVIEKKMISVFVDKTNIYSKSCKVASKCFSFPDKLSFSSNQNILFSLCYQSGGIPKFAYLKKLNRKVQVCTKGEFVVELDELMRVFKLKK